MSEKIAVVLLDPTTGLPYTAVPVTIGSTVDRTASGSITSTQNVAISTTACGSAGIQVSGTWTGTLDFELTFDGLAWSALSVTPTGGGSDVSSTTANGNWTTEIQSYQQIRVIGNTVTSGSASIFLAASTATSTIVISAPLPTGDNTIGRVKVTDGTDVLLIDGSGQAMVNVGISALPTGAAKDATLTGGDALWRLTSDKVNVAAVQNTAPTTEYGAVVRLVPPDATAPAGVQLSDGSAAYTAAKTGQLPTSIGQTTKAASLSVAIASDQIVSVREPTGATWTESSVASSATSVTILASNANRLGMTLFNNSTSTLYLRFSSSAATTTTANGLGIPPSGYYEMPKPIYTGAITGIWSAANGSAQIEELT